MHKSVAVVIALLVAGSAFAGTASEPTAFQFHVKLTDGRSALLANPNVADLKLTEEQVEKAANDRVLLLDETTGTSWTWLMLSWLESKPNTEHGLNRKGTAVPGKNADIGLTPIDQQTLKVRCLHEECTVTAGAAAPVRLKNGESTNVAFDSDVQVTFR
jgi:hypothetical protein